MFTKDAAETVRGVTARFGISMATVLFAVTAGCTGSIGFQDSAGGDPGGSGGNPGQGGDDVVVIPGPGGDSGGGTPFTFTRPRFECNQSASPASIGLRRLTSDQYRNTLRDLISFALRGDANATMQVWSGISQAVARFPVDERHMQNALPTYRQMNQALQQPHVEESYNIAVAIGAALTTSARLGTVVGACATDGNTANDNQCITDFITRFGERALRRPLTGDEVTFYRGFYGTNSASDPAAWADVIAGLLTAPQFLYFVEHGEDAVPGRDATYRLSAFELASRLSYHFLQSMPDEELWQAARSGELLDAGSYERQVDRLMSKAEARRSTREFFEDYLRLADTEVVDKNRDNAQFRTFAGNNLPTSMLRQAMIEDAVDMAQWHTWDMANGNVNALLTSERSFARSPELASIYGVPAWNGNDEPPLFPSEQHRAGIFTRAAFTATGMVTTRPIIKGAHLRESWMCDHIPPPPPGAANEPVDTNNRTTRQAVELITEQEGTTCRGCHQLYTNPIGFATEHFDGLGRFRNEEQLFDNGMPAGTAPVNASAQPQIHVDDPRTVNHAGELMALVAESGKVEACLARHYFRFTYARMEDDASDGCALEGLRQEAIGSGKTLRGMFRAVALQPEFRQRKIQ